MKWLFVMICGLSIPACSTLNHSEANLFLNLNGSYFCPTHPLLSPHPESLAEQDVSKIRCYQDQWTVRDRVIHFNRIFFQTSGCDTPIGRLHFSHPLPVPEKKPTTLVIDKINCEFIKSDADWLGEENGKCMLHTLPIDKPSPVSAFNSCRKSIPSFCFDPSESISLNVKQSDLLSVQAKILAESCGRNPP